MSIFNIVNEHYNMIPEWVLRFGSGVYYSVPERIRYGKDFYKTYQELKKVDKMSEEEIMRGIDERFFKTVHHAYEHVPFYKRLYDQHGVDMSKIHGVKDIENLPFIDKQTLREYAKDMIADDVDKSGLIYLTTSGSTGTPVGLYQPSSMTMIEWAYVLNIWGRIGYRPDSSRLVLRGKKIYAKSKDPDIFYDPLKRELSCNIYNFNAEQVERYCDAIEKYKPEFIHGYMSAIIMFAKYVEINGRKLNHRFKGILATSENVLQDQKEYVERVLKARVFSFYGHTERAVIAGECENSTSYHIDPFYGYCELIDSNGRHTEHGEMVATGFLNQAMPLIRYRTGDLAVLESSKKCNCERNMMRLKSVEGRTHLDVIINVNSAEMPMTAFNNIHASEFDKVIRYKIIQDKIGEAVLRVQVTKEFSNDDAQVIKRLMEEKADYLITFTVEVVDSIPIQANGKYRVVEQNVKM